MRRPEREHDAVLECGGLELEVELAAEALAQREAPGPVDARAEGRVDDEVGVAHVVEEALEHDGVERRQRPERRLAGGEVLGELRGRDCVELLLVAQPRLEPFRPAVGERPERVCAQARDRRGELVAARRRLADPERQRRRHAAGVLHEDLVHLDLLHAVRGVAELEDVAGHALEREVLADRADAEALGVQHDVVVELVRDHAGVGHGREPRALRGRSRRLTVS